MNVKVRDPKRSRENGTEYTLFCVRQIMPKESDLILSKWRFML
jgi:hypothetical protein